MKSGLTTRRRAAGARGAGDRSSAEIDSKSADPNPQHDVRGTGAVDSRDHGPDRKPRHAEGNETTGPFAGAEAAVAPVDPRPAVPDDQGLAALIDRVIIPALVNRLLNQHGIVKTPQTQTSTAVQECRPSP